MTGQPPDRSTDAVATAFAARARALQPELVALRRAIHRDPEVGLHLPRTQARVLDAITPLDLEVSLGRATTSVVAVLRGGRPGPTVLLRGDMDALPIRERTDLDYSSTGDAMHACGHDLHTAGLVGAARLLAEQRDELAGDVTFMFQPGEEGHGGAAIMLSEGLLEASGSRPVAAYAVHVGSRVRGLFMTRSDAVLASSNEVFITLHGRGGHGSRPTLARDPVPALAQIVLALQSLVTRRTEVHDPVVLSVTQLQASHAVNVIADTASLGATLRAFATSTLDSLERDINRLADGVAAAHGLTADVRFERKYPATVTDGDETRRAIAVITETFGGDRFQYVDQPLMGSEDFSFVLDEVPGCYIMLGARPDAVPEAGAPYPHSPRVVFDDSVLADQATLLALLAVRRLRSAAESDDLGSRA